MQEHPKAHPTRSAPPGGAPVRSHLPEGLLPHGLLPHQGRALLLARLLSRSASRAEATALIAADHPYAVRGAVEATIALELFAQTAALVSVEPGAVPREGRLAAVPELELEQEFIPVGSEVTVAVEREGDHGTLTRFSGVLSMDGRTIARGVVVVALTAAGATGADSGAEQ